MADTSEHRARFKKESPSSQNQLLDGSSNACRRDVAQRGDSSERLLRSTTRATPLGSTEEFANGEFFDRYRLLRQLGHGGMGIVYEAFDPKLERKIALKVIYVDESRPITDPTTSNYSVAQSRLVLEAQIQARLSHPNIVTVYDVGNSRNRIYLAMELVNGQTVMQWLDTGRRSWRQVIAVFLQAAAGLAAAHGSGLIHRDFKPDNLLLGEDGRVRVADFGLAMGQERYESRTFGQSAWTGEVTFVDQEIAGTPPYMAPEQLRGGKITAKSDQYAFCVSLYEALYGCKPFKADSRAALIKAIETRSFVTTKHRQRVPAWLHQLVVRGLSPSPNERFESVHELMQCILEHRGRRVFPLVCGILGAAFVVGSSFVWIDGIWQKEQICEDRAAKVREVWSPETWQAVESAFFASMLPFASDALKTVSRVVTDRVEEWGAASLAVCRQNVSTSFAAPVNECLDGQLTELQTLAAVYRQASTADVRDAAKLVTSLPHADNCITQSQHEDMSDRPRDARLLAGYIDLSRQLHALQAAAKLAGHQTLQQDADRMLAQASELAIPALLAPIFIMHSRLAASQLQVRNAQRDSDRSLIFAHASRSPALRVAIMREQIYLRGYKFGIDEAASDIYELGQAYIKCAGSDPVEIASTCIASAPYLLFSGRGDDAEQCLRAALETMERVKGPLHADTIQALEYLAIAISYRRIDVESETLLLRALKSIVDVAGPWHPSLAMTYYNLATLSHYRSSVFSAHKYLEQALAITQRTTIELELRLMIDLTLAEAQNQLGSLSGAKSTYRRCLNTLQEVKDAMSNGPKAACQLGLALSEIANGDYTNCELPAKISQHVMGMKISGLFGEEARLTTIGYLREVALKCGDMALARTIEDQRVMMHRMLSETLGTTDQYADLDALGLQVRERGSAAVEAILRARLATKLPQTQMVGRSILLELRNFWARLLLDLQQPDRALAILENDAPYWEEGWGSEPTSTWTRDVMRARAMLQMGRHEQALTLVESLPGSISSDDQDRENAAYLYATLGRAKLAGDSLSPSGRNALSIAREHASKLRYVPPGLRKLLD